MNGVMLSTKGTNDTYKMSSLVSGVIMAISGLALIFIFAFMASNEPILLIMGLAVAAWGIIVTIFKVNFSKSYLDIYEDHISGKGIKGKSVYEFDMPNKQINNISTKGMNIFISTTGSGTYKIISDKDTAKKVYDYYNRHMLNK